MAPDLPTAGGRRAGETPLVRGHLLPRAAGARQRGDAARFAGLDGDALVEESLGVAGGGDGVAAR